MSDLTVGITGAVEMAAVLDGIAGRVADPSPVADGIHAAFLAIEARRFDAEGPGWAALTDSTVANKARLGQPETILEATGKLRASFTEWDAAGAVFRPVFTADGMSITMGSDLRPDRPGRGWESTALAFFHQDGTDRMPARPVIDTSDGELAGEATTALAAWLLSGAVSIDV